MLHYKVAFQKMENSAHFVTEISKFVECYNIKLQNLNSLDAYLCGNVPSLSVGALKGQGSITNHLWTADLITSPSSDKTETKQYESFSYKICLLLLFIVNLILYYLIL